MATAFKDSSALGDGLGESPRIAEGGGGVSKGDIWDGASKSATQLSKAFF